MAQKDYEGGSGIWGIILSFMAVMILAAMFVSISVGNREAIDATRKELGMEKYDYPSPKEVYFK